MALYSIRENTDVATILHSEVGLGSVFYIETTHKNLSEKRDQSSLPRIIFSEEGKPTLRGPHNIIRSTLEFAIDERNDIIVYLGSPTEIAATLYDMGMQAFLKTPSFKKPSYDEIAYFQWLAFADDPQSFSEIAAKLGLALSERTARRIMDGTIKPLCPVIELLINDGSRQISETSIETESSESSVLSGYAVEDLITTKQKPTHQKKVKFAPDDLREFSEGIKAAYDNLAQKYYLTSSCMPQITVKNNEIQVRIAYDAPSDI